ncbi:transposase [Escherichia coli]|nr:transposase [Escherichia coli]
MSHQLTFADSEFSTKRRQTRKEIFLSRMEQILPWQNMTAVIEPFYPKAGNGRRPYPLETMLRIHCMQHWYNLSDGAMEDALYEIASMRLFARLSLDSALPDRTTIMNFRHLLEQHQLARQLFKTINRWLAEAGVMMTQGTLNRPGFPGECFICELRLPDHRFRWKHNKLFLLLPEEYGPAFPAIVDCYTSPPT